MRSRYRKRGSAGAGAEELPERVRERFPGRGRFHVRTGGDESRLGVGTTALTDQTQATIYVPWAREMTEDMVEGSPERSRRRRETVKTFLEGFSQEEASVLIGRIGQAIKEEDL